jgi:hypothetical protein
MNRIEELCGKLIDEILSEEESAELGRLLENPAHATDFRGLLRTEADLRGQLWEPDLVEETMSRIREQLGGQIEQEVLTAIHRRSAAEGQGKRLFWRSVLPLAAAASVVAAVGVWWMVGGRSSVVSGSVVARVEAVSGFSVQCSGKEKRQLTIGDEVRAGARLETGKDGLVTLAWAGQSISLQLDGNSTLNTRHLTLALLERGRLTATVAKQAQGKAFVIETPHARATVVGTKFGLTVQDRSKDSEPNTDLSAVAPGAKAEHRTPNTPLPLTRLDVVQGQVSFSDRSGRSVDVGAGEYAVAEAGRPVAAFPAGVDYGAVAGLRSQYRDGLLVFEDNFDGPPQGWLALVAEDSLAGGWNTRPAALKTGPAVPVDQVGVAEAKIRGKSTKMLRLRSPAADNLQYGAWGEYTKKMRSYSVDLTVIRESGPLGPGRSGGVITGVRLPAGVSSRLIAGSESPELPLDKPTAVRLEYVMEMEDASNAVVDAKVFHDGHLRGWSRTRGRAAEFGGELLVSAVNGSLLVDDVVVRRLVPDRVTDGLLVLYLFNEGKGVTIRDVSGIQPPLDLMIQKPALARWLGQGIAINGQAQITSAMSGRLTDAWRTSGALTLEWWDKPLLDDKTQGQTYAFMDLVSRTDVFTCHQILYEIPADAKALSTHYTMTLAAGGRALAGRLFCNGRLHSDVIGGGEATVRAFSGDGLRLQLPGGQASGRGDKMRSWTGECHLLAIYGRALSPEEIWRNYQAGPP